MSYREIQPEVRWVRRTVEETSVLVLQQKKLDGWGNPYWEDVPIVDEETEQLDSHKHKKTRSE
jgi:hypothetical protein